VSLKPDEIRKIGVVGAGLMGHGIAQSFAIKGYEVTLFDTDPEVLKSAPERIRRNLGVFLELNLVSQPDMEACIRRIELCDDLGPFCEKGDFIIEAIQENLKAKLKVFEALERQIDSHVVITSNTSAISITRLSHGLRHRERFLGTHFWNPPHIVPCVEVIKGEETSEDVFETVFEIMKKIGKQPVRVLKDVPGFLGNRLQHAMWREAMSLAEKNIAAPEDIDKVVKYGFGLRLPFIGPLETADLAGLDLSYDVQEYLFPFLENASKPSEELKNRVEEGLLGVKTGKGFYDWPEKKKNRVINSRDRVLLKILGEVLLEASQNER